MSILTVCDNPDCPRVICTRDEFYACANCGQNFCRKHQHDDDCTSQWLGAQPRGAKNIALQFQCLRCGSSFRDPDKLLKCARSHGATV